jgi:hypothetical protein
MLIQRKSENTKFLTLEFMNFGIFIMSGFEKGYEVPKVLKCFLYIDIRCHFFSI